MLDRNGILSRSGTLTHEAASILTLQNIRQGTCVGIGGDPVSGSSFENVLKLSRDDADVVLLIGEIGGSAEEKAAAYLSSVDYGKPVISFIAGATAPAEKKMGRARVIIPAIRVQ